LSNDFTTAAEFEMIPRLEKTGAKLVKGTLNEVSFSLKDFLLSIYVERNCEVYAVVTSLKIKQSVSLSELLLDYLNVDDKGLYHLSDRYTIKSCMKNITDTIISKILPLILDGTIYEAINTVLSKRKEELLRYNESLIEKEAKKAFEEKRYVNVISSYAQISQLNNTQKKRLEISNRRTTESR